MDLLTEAAARMAAANTAEREAAADVERAREALAFAQGRYQEAHREYAAARSALVAVAS